MISSAPLSLPHPVDAAPTDPPIPASIPPLQPNATGCNLRTECKIPLPHLNTTTINNDAFATYIARPLSDKQQLVLDYILAGTEDDHICTRFRIHRATLFRWKYRHPLFIAELNGRQHDLWNDIAGELRAAASKAVHTVRGLLSPGNLDAVRLRAARTLIQLVNAHRVPHTAANPVHLNDILDKLLQQQQPTAPANSTFTDTQRQSLLTQLLSEDASAESQEEADAQARRNARKNRQTVAQTTPSAETPPNRPPLVAGSPTSTATAPE